MLKSSLLLIGFLLGGYTHAASLFVWDETPGHGGTSGNFSQACWYFNSDVSTATSVAYTGTNTPGAQAYCYIGYTFSYEDNRQVYTQTNTAITVTAAGAYKYLWLGNNVTFSMATWPTGGQTVYLGTHSIIRGSSNGFSSNSTYNYDFGSFSGDAKLSMGSFWMQSGARVNFTGNLAMTADSFTYTLFSATNLAQNSGVWNASGVSVTDMHGKSLDYAGYFTDATQIDRGQYGLVLDGGSVKLLANGTIPEPATATLGLFGLSALMMRRRRK